MKIQALDAMHYSQLYPINVEVGLSAVRSHLHLCLCQLSPGSLKVGGNDHCSEDEQHKSGAEEMEEGGKIGENGKRGVGWGPGGCISFFHVAC